MIALIMTAIRWVPLVERVIGLVWVGYKAWRLEYDDNKAKVIAAKALMNNSTVALNDELNKK